MTARLRCGRCGAEASDDPRFGVSIAYTATADGSTAGLDQGDILVTWDQSGVMDRLLDVFVTCGDPDCGHTWRTRRAFATVVAAGRRGPPPLADVDPE